MLPARTESFFLFLKVNAVSTFDRIQSTINLFWGGSTEYSWKCLVQASVQKVLYLTYSLNLTTVVFLPTSFSRSWCAQLLSPPPCSPCHLLFHLFLFLLCFSFHLLLLFLCPSPLPLPRYYNVCHALKNISLGLPYFHSLWSAFSLGIFALGIVSSVSWENHTLVLFVYFFLI